MADENLTIGVNADVSNATVSFSDLLKALEQTTISTKGVADGLSTAEKASDGASAGLKKLGGAAAETDSVLDKLGEHAGVLARGLDAIGLESAGAAERLGGLAEALKGFAGAAPEFIAIVAAITAVTAGFDIFKDAVTSAGDLDEAMVRLGSVITNQGGDWGRASGQVRDYLENLERTTSFTGKEGVDAIERMVLAGHNLADSETYVSVAEGVAAATGMSLVDATDLLRNASEGHARALVSLGLLKQQDIKDGLTQEQMLQKVYDATKNVAEATANTLPGALGQAHAAFEALLETIGQPAQSTLIALVKEFTDFARHATQAFLNVEDAAKRWADNHRVTIAVVTGLIKALVIDFRVAFDEIALVIKEAMDVIELVVDTVVDALLEKPDQISEDWETVWGDMMHNIQTAFGNFGENLITIAGRIVQDVGAQWKNLGKIMLDAMTGNFAQMSVDAALSASSIQKTFSDVFANLKPWTLGGDNWAQMFYTEPGKTPAPPQLQQDGVIPGEAKPKAPPGAGFQPNPVADAFGDPAKTKDAFDATQAMLDALKTKEDELKQAMEGASTVAGYNAANLELMRAKAVDAKLAIDVLKGAVQEDTTAQQDAAVTLFDSKLDYETYRTTLNAFNETLRGKTKLTAADKQYQQQLSDAMKQAAKDTKDAQSAYDAATESLKKHSDQLEKAKNSAIALADAEKDATAKLSRDWETFIDKQAQQYQEDLATAQMTDQQKVIYYAQMAASINAIDQESLARKEQYATKELEAYKAMLSDIAAARKKEIDEATKDVDSFLEAIIEKHESFKSAIKTILADIQKQYLQAFSGAITNSKGFQGLFGGGAPQPNPQVAQQIQATTANTTTINSNTTALNTLGTQQNQSLTANTSGLTTNTTAINTLSTQIQAFAAKMGGGSSNSPTSSLVPLLTGSQTGISPSSYQAVLNTQDPTQAQTTIANAAPSAGSTPGPNTKNTTGSDISGGLSILSGLEQGGNFGEVLGGAGAVVGGIFGGPIGSAIGSTVGNFLGGLFGPHETAADQPDVSDTSHYGQFVADYSGAQFGANGQTFLPTLADYTGAGGTDVEQQMEQYLQQNQNDASSLPPAYQALLNKIANLGSNPQITDEKQGQFYLADGQQISVTNLENLVSQFQELTSGNSSVPVFNVHGTAPNFMNNVVQQIGAYSNQTGIYNPIGTSMSNGTVTSAVQAQGTTININLPNSIIADQNSMDTLVLKITQAYKQFSFQNRFNSNANAVTTI